MERLNVNPNRMELAELRSKLTTAKQGHELLKGKQDELVHRFIELLNESRRLRLVLTKQFTGLYQDFSLVGAEISPEFLEEALMASGSMAALKASEKSIMGVRVPAFDYTLAKEDIHYPYSFSYTSSELDVSIRKCHSMMEEIIKLAEMEKACELLANEIEKIRRRVNALEFMTIPQLKESIRYIQMKLDENERGNLVRLIKVKNKIKSQAAVE
ncbi:V-type ATP synthase subunit D [Anaerocolumna sp. AGMB13020]|uniref:V-type ATP synthase subunit D n=1 Tax=Anaerocolumna sp. AGMB13020 TaxID=3081750 RepID=UPI00295594B8|nr:V-type ATP synthase subunit D [Anaerocolumna sp. AGMB13020]WOO37650.1 V-type ATP synthase subunit D [Anaerocolumna sp. AGMB13020]